MSKKESDFEGDEGNPNIPEITHDILAVMQNFQASAHTQKSMTGRERMRLYGAKSRNLGLITAALNIAQRNPYYMPAHFSLPDMTEAVRRLKEMGQLTMILEQFLKLANDELLTASDRAYHDALLIYRNLQTQHRSRVPGVSVLFEELSQFFARSPRRPGEAEPTERERERDLERLPHGKADGETVIPNAE